MNKWLLVSIILLSSCSPKVVSYLNTKAPFKQYETYRVVTAKADSKNITPENTLVFDLIKEHIHNQMRARDYEQSNVSPDLTLRYEVTSSTRVESNNTQNNPFYFQPYQITSRTIYESIILLELFDSNKKLVWQGSYDLRQEKKEKRVSRAIEKAIGYIFTTYPYKANSNQVDESLKTFEKKKKK
ncbi:DUF4136 domain-containing protein [Ekhidna sp.]|uniref:DUF4136 domain-containing protein n=1 Tax=Ekhidna sp. TaxID=2608089 RepID=UPI0032ED98EF